MPWKELPLEEKDRARTRLTAGFKADSRQDCKVVLTEPVIEWRLCQLQSAARKRDQTERVTSVLPVPTMIREAPTRLTVKQIHL